ncbi:MAG TPA: hypothetical protein VJV78_23695 [Polyangiales bacterium]|nr:hypothetical protein [Polyangiales bacterium]
MCKVLVLLVCGFALAACGTDDLLPPQTPISRNFAALAEAVAGCVDVLHECDDQEDAGARGSAACKTQFLDCRKSAGKSSENDLAEAIGACRDRHDQCKADAGNEKGREACAQVLRTCIGDARSTERSEARDAAAPNADAPTYQCFGQLRQCITDGESPSECAAKARSCVIAAVGDPPGTNRPSSMQPPAAGMRAADMPAGGKGGKGGEGGKSGEGGASGAGMGGAGAGGTGGAKPSDPPRAGAGGSKPADPPAGDPDECAKKQMECVMSGEKPMTCMREQRMCEKGMKP